MNPIIGITTCFGYVNYKYAIKKHGGQVKQLIIGEDHVNTKIDGLLLPGGGDIDPKLYGEVRYHKTQYVDRAKDDYEISLFKNAIEQDIPILAICRGIQIINVAMGGSLYQDIEDLYPRPARNHEKKSSDDWHDISIEADNKLIDIVGERTDRVNSAHHQAVKKIGDELVVTARSEDGIIEAMELEYPSNPFIVAVQYHPERMWTDKMPLLHEREHLEHASKLFESFIAAAAGNRIS